VLARLALLACVFTCGCDVVFRIDHVDHAGGDDATSAGITYVQSNSSALAGINTIPVTFNDPGQGGNPVVVVLGHWDTPARTLNPSRGNLTLWPPPGLASYGSATLHMMFAASARTADPFTVTATVDGTMEREVTLSIHEYRGLAASPLDQAVLAGSSGMRVSSGPITTAGTGERLYFGAMLQDDTSTVSPGSGFTLRERPTNSNLAAVPTATEDRVGVAQDGGAAEFTLANDSAWVCGLLTFQ